MKFYQVFFIPLPPSLAHFSFVLNALGVNMIPLKGDIAMFRFNTKTKGLACGFHPYKACEEIRRD
jgi:hypothetical protein